MRSVVLALLLTAPVAHADIVRTVERGVALSGKSTAGASRLYVKAGKGGVLLYADGGHEGHGIVSVDGTKMGVLFERGVSRMFYLDSRGKIEKTDRPALAKMLKDQGVTRAALSKGVLAKMSERRVAEQHLATADKKIDAMLASVKSLKGATKLHAGIDFEPGGPTGSMLLVDGKGIFLGGSKDKGFTVSDSERAELAAELLKTR